MKPRLLFSRYVIRLYQNNLPTEDYIENLIEEVMRHQDLRDNGPRDYHTKWSKSGREGQISYDIAYMWKLKYDTNELIYITEIDSQT